MRGMRFESGARVVLLLVATCAVAHAQEVRRGTEQLPLLGDLPVLGHLFQQQRDSLWYPLDEDAAQDFGSSSEDESQGLSFRDRWLMQKLRKRFPEITDVHLVEQATVRWRAKEHERQVRRGLELFGEKSVLAKARAWLDRFQALRRTQVLAEFVIVSAPMPAKARPAAPRVSILDQLSFDLHLTRFKETKGCEILNSPSLILLNGQRGNLSVVNQVSYVRDFKIQIVHGAGIADPVIDVLQEGIVVDVATVVHPDEDLLTLTAKVSLSSLKRPIKEVTTRLSALKDARVTIQLPELEISEWDSEELVLPQETWFLVTGLAQRRGDWSDGPRAVDVLGHVRVIEPEQVPMRTPGRVIGVDREAGRVFVTWPEDSVRDPAAKPLRLSVWRGGSKVGELEVAEWAGAVSICKPLSNTGIKAGDTVK